MIEVYTDGGCSGNPGPGAWAYIVNGCGKVFKNSGYSEMTTNNRMELLAVIEALKAVKIVKEYCNDRVKVFTDSEYVRKGITEWIKKWETNGWLNSKKKPVKNSDLWRELKDLSDNVKPLWEWVRGHSGNKLNEECDRLVGNMIKERKESSVD